MVERMSDGILVPQYLPIKGPTAKERAAKVMPAFPPASWVTSTLLIKIKKIGFGDGLFFISIGLVPCSAEISPAAGIALQLLGNAPECSVSQFCYKVGKSSHHCMNPLPFPKGGLLVFGVSQGAFQTSGYNRAVVCGLMNAAFCKHAVPWLVMECPDGRLQAAATFEVRHPWCSDTDCTVLELCETPGRAKETSAAPRGLP